MASGLREFSPQFWAVILATFLGFLGIGTVLPGLAPHVRLDLGGSDETVGFVIGVFSFVALGARFFSGALADNKGRKYSYASGVFCCAMAGAVYLAPLGIAGVYLARVLQGFGEAFLYTGAATWAVELAGTHRSAQALGYVSSGIWGGMSAGPVLGHWLGSFSHAAATQSLLALASFGLVLRVPERFKPHPHNVKRSWLPRRMLLPGFAVGFVNVHYPVITGFLILHLARHGDSGPAAFTAYAVVILFSRFFLGSLPDRVHPRITYYIGLAGMTIGLLVLASGPPPLRSSLQGFLALAFPSRGRRSSPPSCDKRRTASTAPLSESSARSTICSSEPVRSPPVRCRTISATPRRSSWRQWHWAQRPSLGPFFFRPSSLLWWLKPQTTDRSRLTALRT